MKVLKKMMRFIKSPWKIIYRFSGRRWFQKLPDRWVLAIYYRIRMGKKLRLENPQTFNEKLQWLKLYNRQPEYTMMVDKYLVRDYIAERLGEEYLIPLLGVWDDPADVDFQKLPDRFVLKCNHNSGLGMCICKDKSQLDFEKVREGLSRGLCEDFYLKFREWPYKNVPRKIIAEKFMENPDGSDLQDYKIHCFNGEPKVILVCKDRFSVSGLTEDFFDTDWNHLSIARPTHPNSSSPIPRPKALEKMLELAKILSDVSPFARIDFYEIGGRVYFGEITFFPSTGLVPFVPKEWDAVLGSWLRLPERK